MNKAEYLNALKEALKDIDKDIMNEILADYEEHFQAGMENGKTEEEICQELGSIDDLVKEIKEAYGTDNNQNDSKKSKQKGAFHFRFDKSYFDNMNADTIGDMINSALNSAGEAISEIDVKEISKNVKSTLDQAATAFGDFTDSCMNGMGFDTGSSYCKTAEGTTEDVSISYGTVSEEEESSKENVDGQQQTTTPLKLVVDGIGAEIIVKKSENGKLNLRYSNNGNERQKQRYEFYSCQEGDTVYAGIRKVGRSVFLMDFNEKSLNITVELPQTMENVQLKTASGSIEVKDCMMDSLIMNSASGNLKIDKVSATDCQLKSVSGYIDMREVNSVRMKGNTTSGNIITKNADAKTLFLKSTSGSLDFNHVKAKVMDCGTLSGNIKFRDVEVSECKVRSTSGDIFINDFKINNADIDTISGELDLSNVTGDGLRANTVSGSIMLDVKVNKCYAGSKSGHIDIQSNADILLESTNISGNVDVHLKNSGNGYRINSRTTSGRLTVDYEQQHSSNLKTGTYSYGNQGSDLTLSTISGVMHLKDN